MSRKETRPDCFSCCGKKAKSGSKFCSKDCAAWQAEQLTEGQMFCFKCRAWQEGWDKTKDERICPCCRLKPHDPNHVYVIKTNS
jgi:hypothetical protein